MLLPVVLAIQDTHNSLEATPLHQEDIRQDLTPQHPADMRDFLIQMHRRVDTHSRADTPSQADTLPSSRVVILLQVATPHKQAATPHKRVVTPHSRKEATHPSSLEAIHPNSRAATHLSSRAATLLSSPVATHKRRDTHSSLDTVVNLRTVLLVVHQLPEVTRLKLSSAREL